MAERPDIVVPRIDILDLFLGQGRTIRRSKTTPGTALLQGKYEHVRHKLPPKLDEKKIDEVNLDAPKDESKQDKPDANTSKGDTKTEDAKDNNDTGKPNMEFPPEQDAELLRLKEENTSWKAMAAAIGKPVWQLKQRHGELKANKAAAAAVAVTAAHDKPNSNVSKPASGTKAVSGKEQKAESEAKSKKEATKDDDNSKKEMWDQFKKQHAQKQQPPKPKQAPKTPTPPANSVIAPSSTTGTLFELTEDDMFSYSELQLLVEVLEADVGMVWDRVASAFFNKTGRRILPLDIKDKLRGMQTG